MADAVEAAGERVDQEPADEFAWIERHRLESVVPFDPVILPPEGDAVMVERDQAAVGDGDAMGVGRQIGQHGFRPAERALAVDHPFASAQRCQMRRKGLRVGERGVIAEELQTTGLVCCHELLQEQPSKEP